MIKSLLLITLTTAIFSTTAFAGDATAGKAKSVTCAACHGNDGISKVGIYPNLRGQKEAYLKKQLQAFKSGARQDPMMAGMAKPLSDKDIENLAAYYASLK